MESIEKNIKKNKIENSKNFKESVFKSSLIIAISMIVLFFFLILMTLVTKGVSGFGEFAELNFNYFITGQYYDLYNGLLPGGLLIINTLWTSFLAVLIAVPISVLTALFITRVLPRQLRGLMFSVVAILAAVPSVIYGAFGLGFVDQIINDVSGVQGAILSIVITVALMIIPTITLITVTSINSVDRKMENSSLALGATKMQTNYQVTLKAIKGGVITGTMLGLGRALGEATAVSMVASESSTLPSFGLFEHTRLLTTSMLKGFGEVSPGSVEEAYMFALGLLLIFTVFVVFYILKKVKKGTDVNVVSKKQSAIANEIVEINTKINDSNDLSMLSKKEQKVYKNMRIFNIKNRINIKKNKDQFWENSYISNKNSSSKVIKKKKIRKSRKLGLITFMTAMFGILTLAFIIGFLFKDGFSYLTWDFISTSGIYENLNGVDIYGLKVPFIGTLLMIFLTMIMALPLGLAGGIYFSEFAKENKINSFLITTIELLTSVPSLIFGLIGAIIFLPFASAIGFAPLAGAITMTFMVVPTIIKTTEESINEVKKSNKNGSLALGATKHTTSLKISSSQAMPGIISGALLSVGRIMGESAAIVMIYGLWPRDSGMEWLQYGGTTLATEIYRLTGDFKEIPWEAVKAIGIMLMLIIFLLSMSSYYIKEREWINSGILFLGFSLIILSIIIGIFSIFIIGLCFFIIPILVSLSKYLFMKFSYSKYRAKIPVRLELLFINFRKGKR